MHRDEALEFYRGERARFEKSRDIQWKFDIAIWTLVALGIQYLPSNTITSKPCISFIFAFLFIFGHTVFSCLVQKGLIASRTRSDDIMSALNAAGDPDIDTSRGRTKWETGDILWIIFQALSTTVLLGFYF